ncbi:hypothetical protein PMAYCL1PPCAC_00967, partial [Pristionchus mayeri]
MEWMVEKYIVGKSTGPGNLQSRGNLLVRELELGIGSLLEVLANRRVSVDASDEGLDMREGLETDGIAVLDELREALGGEDVNPGLRVTQEQSSVAIGEQETLDFGSERLQLRSDLVLEEVSLLLLHGDIRALVQHYQWPVEDLRRVDHYLHTLSDHVQLRALFRGATGKTLLVRDVAKNGHGLGELEGPVDFQYWHLAQRHIWLDAAPLLRVDAVVLEGLAGESEQLTNGLPSAPEREVVQLVC